MKTNIEQLKKDIADAKTRHSEATKDIKHIEKDMNDFSNNKDSKLAELQSSLDTLKKSQSKNSTAVKTLQKELQAARLESEQSGGDLAAAQEQLVEVESTLKAQADEIETLQKEQSQVKVRPLSQTLPNNDRLTSPPGRPRHRPSPALRRTCQTHRLRRRTPSPRNRLPLQIRPHHRSRPLRPKTRPPDRQVPKRPIGRSAGRRGHGKRPRLDRRRERQFRPP